MLTIRHIYDLKQKNYFKNLYEQYGLVPDNHMFSIKSRQDFFTTYVLERVNFLSN
jgi:hypothetical protein